MTKRISALLCVAALLTACGSPEEGVSTDEMFDAAVDEMTRAYFTHVPEAATQLGIPEDVVAGTFTRMMDRSVAGNAVRNEALETALASLQDFDAAPLPFIEATVRNWID
jgi:hypothetical protein